jgi:hypothetical protein
MKSFLQGVSGQVLGVLSGFDRLMFRGHLRTLMNPHGMNLYCWTNDVRFTNFKTHAQDRTEVLLAAALAEAKRLDRPIEYLPSAAVRKEDLARKLAQRDGITQGLVGVFTALEPCWSYSVRGNRGNQRLEFRREMRKCLHVYHYYQHRLFGLLYARVQSWFPFTVQVGLNGREWLARSLDVAKVPYRRNDNCLTWVKDFAKAQALLDEQLQVNWSSLLDAVRGLIHPAHPQLLGKFRADYYWSLTQSEWATDVVFRDPASLASRYEPWLRFALTSFASPDVLRFLGKKPTAQGHVNGHFAGEVLSDLGHRVDGMRIKHCVGKNSVKMYDKASGVVLRVETTINDPGAFKVYRPKASDPEGGLAWQTMRSGVADVHRRAEVSQTSNERYLECVAAATHAEPLAAVTAKLSRRVTGPGGSRRVRGLNLLSEADAALLAVVGRPEFGVSGLRNRDVVAGLYDRPAADAEQRRRRSARVTQLLRLLRAHGVLHKVAKSHRYRVSESGRVIITAVLAARNAATQKLVALAA